MQLEGKTVVLTGAAGGMGSLLARSLADAGARLLLTDINGTALELLAAKLGSEHVTVPADLGCAQGRAQLVDACNRLQGIDVLINAAGVCDYAMLEQQSVARMELMTRINLLVPMLLCQALLPHLRARAEAAIVNIGSTFGAIGHPGFATYCGNKAGLRGFTEALRRELADTPIGVFYIAPRATRTDMNSAAVVALNEELGNAMDAPEVVVDAVMKLLRQRRGGDYFLGWPEKLFVRINSLLPALVDGALAKQLGTIRRLAG